MTTRRIQQNTTDELNTIALEFKRLKSQLKDRHQEVLQLIEQKTNQARELIREAEDLADLAGVSFHFSIEYGMGGTYDEGRWHASSQSC